MVNRELLTHVLEVHDDEEVHDDLEVHDNLDEDVRDDAAVRDETDVRDDVDVLDDADVLDDVDVHVGLIITSLLNGCLADCFVSCLSKQLLRCT